ncbi:MAG: YHS domain-containing protein [Burkholderiales bacterium]|jgi:YHS domain-containing protein|nr:YHS domain-containing protein [Burkholderiales bacterium]
MQRAPRSRACLLALASTLVNAQATDAPRVALKGYDVVAYFTGSKAQPGSADFRTDFDGMRYQFSSAQNKTAFGANPDRYLPQFGGYCAMGVAPLLNSASVG